MASARQTALNILYNIEKKASYINIELDSTLSASDLSDIDKRFTTEIVHGVIKNKMHLDYIISCYSKVKLAKMNDKLLIILRMGIYQIMYMDKVPPSAAVNESVKLVKKCATPAFSGFANGILRNVIRNLDNISYPKDFSMRISVKYSYPLWMVDRLKNSLGEERCENIIKAQSERPSVYLRCNRTKTDAKKLCEKLNNVMSASIYHNDYFPTMDYCLKSEKMVSLSGIKEFEDGEFYVQDISSMIVGEVVNPKENSLVIDVCAAPGGKTTHIAEIMNNTGKVIAFDKYEHKINLINENAKRLSLKNIQAICHDSSKLNTEFEKKADYVLCDAPCSGLGIISRKPDIKYSVTEEDIESLSKLSYSILETSSGYVKPGGVLVFSLCTFTKEESIDNVHRFLENNKDFYLDSIQCINIENDGYITLYPDIHSTDGFFVCRMKRKGI